ncbi:hypothetical protein MPLA_140245 [Mesorhizobium sp. ORS 3359]|nr:hypothetical protein MPLA_140245 [Mesorhizobium sp. ORS 3359]
MVTADWVRPTCTATALSVPECAARTNVDRSLRSSGACISNPLISGSDYYQFYCTRTKRYLVIWTLWWSWNNVKKPGSRVLECGAKASDTLWRRVRAGNHRARRGILRLRCG